MDLNNRVVVITGATGGLGSVASRAFAREGCILALVGRDQASLDSLATSLDVPPDHLLTIAADVSNADQAQNTAETVIERFGRADILLHVVGGWTGGTAIEDLPADELEKMLQQHVWSTFYTMQAFTPHLKANKWGRVLAVSSPTASRPKARSAAYAAAKAAQQALFNTLAQEVKGTGVTANLVLVNTIDTKHEREKSPSAINASWTTPEEIVSIVLYLCSEEASMINGAMIPLFGAPL